MKRRKTNPIHVGNVQVGGGAPIAVQSMCNTDTRDVAATVAQIHRMEQAGCDITRVAVVDQQAARAIYEIKQQVNIPIVADIHFDYRLALECVAAGVDKIRINPGNIGGDDHVKAVADACRTHNIPIRIGVNGGSLEKEILAKYGRPCPEALVESALYHVSLLEKFDFDQIAISIKSSNVQDMIDGYRLLSSETFYPLHLGVTEAGTYHMGLLKSAIGIGSLLCDGIGDTLRVSLTDDPVLEIGAGLDILKACGLREDGIRFVSCPTCGRCSIDLISLAKRAETELADIRKPVKVAIMGCVVNGPGEAREADIGIAGGGGEGILFKKGEILRRVPYDEILAALREEIEKLDV
ncbi:MAG: flavodoxin-dependent (E)-4-hydroxy-3-methylbut-2-enyl-diphosphate synthase [Eubacteriales bacterium]|jgi:(E)-4-hydroxy-3-methylbut-2-enyl-diphosphate synthase